MAKFLTIPERITKVPVVSAPLSLGDSASLGLPLPLNVIETAQLSFPH